MGQVWITAKIHRDLGAEAKSRGVRTEALLNVLLRLGLADEAGLGRVVHLIKNTDLGGEEDLTTKGW